MKRGLIAFVCVLLTPSFPASAQRYPAEIQKIKDVVIYEDSLFYCAFPSVVRRPDGDLLVAFRRAPDRRRMGEQDNLHCDQNSYLVMVRSGDGEAWSREPELISAYPFGGSQDPCLLQLNDGTLLCTSYAWTLKPAAQRKQSGGGYGDWAFLGGYYLRSADGGLHWDGPFYPPALTRETLRSPYGNVIPACNRGALYEGGDGRIHWGVIANNGSRTSVHLLTSDDRGASWNCSAEIASSPDITFNETSMYETPGGDIVAFIRTSGVGDTAYISRSTDGGKTFQYTPMGFRGHPVNALRLPDRRVLLTYGYRHAPYGIRARILNEECTDFAEATEFILRDDGGNVDIGYTWPVLLDENRVLVTYYFNKNDGLRHIAGTILEIRQ
ncbi:MAG: glycoside hydrolase [Tannerella sp.]|jgi:hypothetical protein|nr:glycoside hydrolase [Tannerella sp.]